MADGGGFERWYSAAELAGLPGLPSTERRVHSRGEVDGWQRRRKQRGKGWEYAFASLPPATQAALLLRERPRAAPAQPKSRSESQIASAWQRYEAQPDTVKAVAERRMRAVRALDALIADGMPVMQARQAVAAQLQREGIRGGSAGNLARWQKAVAGAHKSDWLALLVPHHSGRTRTAEIPEQAWDYFKSDWLRVEQPSAASCYERVQRIAAARGWDELPSLRTFTRRIERELPRAVRVLARQGEEAMMRTYPVQERDRGLFEALEGVNSDGHRFDVFVRFPDGAIGRPMIVGWQDLYSGKILSYRLCDHESSDSVRLSLGDLVRRYGIPRHAWLDNGRAFASKWMTGGTRTRYRFKVQEEDPVGLITALGIEVHWVTPYHGQAKPIERAWRDLCCERIAKHTVCAGAYVGNKPTAKPENYGSRAVPWDVFEQLVADEVRAHNARVGRRTKVCAGRSFDQAFAESYAKATVRKVSEEQLRRLLLMAAAVTANPDDGSVRLAGNRYGCDSLSAYAGRKVVLRVDPANLHGSAYVYALDGTYIGEAECLASVGFADSGAAREHARGKTQFRRAQKQMLQAERRMDAAELAAQLPTPPPETLPPAAVIAPVFRDHGQPRPAPTEDEQGAATGTDGLTSVDRWMTALSASLKDKQI